MTKTPLTFSRDAILAGCERSSRLILPQGLVRSLRSEIVPAIRASVDVGYEAYDLDPTHNDQQNLSHYTWRNLLNRMKGLESSLWQVKTSSNDLRLVAKVGRSEYVFRIHRVNPKTRLPRGGRLAKKAAFEAQWRFLSAELEEKFLSFNKGNMIIGYDLSEVTGLGKITVEMLIPTTKKNTPIALTLHTLYESDAYTEQHTDLAVRPAAERIGTPETRRNIEVPTIVRKRKNE